MLAIDDRVGLAPGDRADLESALREQQLLADVVGWMARAEDGELELEAVHDQDEFTNDVVLRWGDRYLVYDCT